MRLLATLATYGVRALWIVSAAVPIAAAATDPEPGYFFVHRANGELVARWASVPEAERYNLYLAEGGDAANWQRIDDVNSPYAHPAPDLARPYYLYVSAVVGGSERLITPLGTAMGFEKRAVAPFGPLAVADINQDGCAEIPGTLNDCNGNLVAFSEQEAGLGALRDRDRAWRDLRLADLTGDGIVDAVANTYSEMADQNSAALLFVGRGDGRFEEDPQLRALDLRGFGETIVVADFNNDGALDVFMPAYTNTDSRQQNFLLLGPALKGFEEIADRSGVANRDSRPKPEGAQAVDLNEDGFLDLYVAGKFFENDGDGLFARVMRLGGGGPTFTETREKRKLPRKFDEGIKFLDWNNDGQLDFLHHHNYRGPRLFENQGGSFREVDVFPQREYFASIGANAYDVNGDGREDIILGGGHDGEGNHLRAELLLNDGQRFVASEWIAENVDKGVDLIAFADLNGDGTVEPLVRQGDVYHHWPQHRHANVIVVEMLGANGERNQFGRSIVIDTPARPGIVFHRLVDGGSGFLTQSQYEVMVPTGAPGRYRVSARYASGPVTVDVDSGHRVRIFEDGRSEVQPLPDTGPPSPPLSPSADS